MIANARLRDRPGPAARPARPGPGAAVAGRRSSASALALLIVVGPGGLADRPRRTSLAAVAGARPARRSARASGPAGPTCLDRPAERADRVRARGGGRRGRLHPRADPGHRAGHRLAPGRRAGRRAGRRRGRHPRLRRPARRPSRPPHPRGTRRRPAAADAVARRSSRSAVVCAALGVLFGAAEVTTVAFAEEQGNKALRRRRCSRSGRSAA